MIILINTRGVTSGARTAYYSGHRGFLNDILGGSCYAIFCFCVVFCISSIVLSPYYFVLLIYDFYLLHWYLQSFLITKFVQIYG